MEQQIVNDIISGVTVTAIGALGAVGIRSALAWRRSKSKGAESSPIDERPQRSTKIEPPELPVLEKVARVLIIDDEDYAYYELLKKDFPQVTRWSTIRNDLARTIEDHYDLVILDVRGVADEADASDGIEALELLRRHNPWIPIVLFTAFKGAIRGARKHAAEEKTQAVMKKLVPFHEFSEGVVRLLRLGFSRAYFEDVLGKLGVRDPASVLAAIEQEPETVPLWELDGAAEGPFTRHKVQRVLSVAMSVSAGTRWRV